MEIRAYLDTNLYISFLLYPNSSAPPSAIVRMGLRGDLTLLFGDPTIVEIQDKTTNKPYFVERISQSQVSWLLQAMGASGDHVRTAPTVIPAIGRDRKDDYLLTYSMAGNATHLVTGDKDLLELDNSFEFRIVTPAQFLALLQVDPDGDNT